MASNDVAAQLMTINIDLETLGIRADDQVYSGAAYSNHNGLERSSQTFLDIRGTQNKKPEELEGYIRDMHSSSYFGEKQYERGSLNGWAKAVADGQTSGMNEYVSSILDMHKNNGGQGSILLAQNLQFENRALSNAYLTGQVGQPFTELIGNISNRSNLNPNSFLEASGISQLNWERYSIINDAIKPAFTTGDKEGLETALGAYREKSFDIIGNYNASMEKAQATNTMAVVDLMDYSKAVYAHGAAQGKIDPRMLLYGNKVDYLAKVLLGEDEAHEALSDAKHQDRLFKILSNEVSQMQTHGSSYDSPIVTKLAASFEAEGVLEKQLKSGATNFIREYLDKNPSADVSVEDIKAGALKHFDYKNRFLIESGTTEGFNFTDFREELNNTLEEMYAKNKDVALDRESFLYDLEDTLANQKHTVKESTKILPDMPKFNKSTALKVGGAGAALFATSMMFGGDKEEQKRVKYNTYDELYNNQYYGSGFADWQNRNNSHKMM